jgi:hypothetical protein
VYVSEMVFFGGILILTLFWQLVQDHKGKRPIGPAAPLVLSPAGPVGEPGPQANQDPPVLNTSVTSVLRMSL